MKHAYLIMAHDDFYILEKLLLLLDDEKNDIYVHIDKKVKNFNFDYYKKIIKKSNLIFIKRMDVRWATYSQIKCELSLFNEAYNNHYEYYHLLSGVDIPLKSQDEIHSFFDENKGKEFISYDYHDKVLESSIDRIAYYHLFTSHLRANKSIITRIFNSLHFRIFNLQKKHKIKRKINFNIRKGANWVSITDGLVGYILENEKFIKKHFKYSYCADELFIQTLVYNSKYYNNLYAKNNDDYNDCKRFIDWNRGLPYTFTSDDYNDLITSDRFFARKFSSKTDKQIIDKIYNYVKGGSSDKN